MKERLKHLNKRGHKGDYMNQAELIARCAEKTELTKTKMKEVLEVIGEVVLEAIQNEQTVTMPLIGRFNYKVSKARSCRNPRTGEIMEVPSKAKMSFSASLFVKEHLKKKAK
jgi:DNA-binding protein HU-beta